MTDSPLDRIIRRCTTCQNIFLPRDVGTCKECYDRVREAKEELMKENNVLRAKVDFLRLSPSLDHGRGSRLFTDVVLIIAVSEDGTASPPITVHKDILVSRSRVFKAMLENEMEETRSGIIKISDISYDALLTFVRFLYTAEAYVDEKMACDLLITAEKYEVNHMKNLCEEYLVTKLTPEASLAAYVFANHHSAKHLSDAAFSLILQNMEMVTKSEEYMELKKRDPRLVAEIYEAYVVKRVRREVVERNFFSGEAMSWSRPPIETDFHCWFSGDRFIQLLRREP